MSREHNYYKTGHGGPRYRKVINPIAGVNLKSEYELILEKKSRLSARQRQMVVAKYERILNDRANETNESGKKETEENPAV